MKIQKKLSACTSILVGKKAMADNSTIIARNEDAKTAWPKHLTVHEHKEFEEEQVFVSNDNKFTIPLPKVRFRYSATPEWTDKFGLFEEDGINEYGVAMSATESAYSNPRVLGADPLVENGISEEAMVTVVLPYIKSAREGVARLGSIIEKYGTSETNGVLFSDEDEVWYFESGSGHHWVAQRIPDDCYAVVANQLAIQKVDLDDPDNFMYSKGIVQFVYQNHFEVDFDNFNFRNVFGTHEYSDEIYSTPRVWYGQKYLSGDNDQDPMSEELPFIRKANRLLHLDDIAYVLGSHYQNTPYDPLNNDNADGHKFRPISLAATQESHILQIRSGMPVDVRGIQWLAMGVTAQSSYIPFYPAATNVHPAYKVGGETYDDKSAYWVYKLAGVLVDAHYKEFSKILKDTQKEVAILLNNKVHEIDAKALTLSGQELRDYLTTESIACRQIGLDKYNELIAKLITASTALSPLSFKVDVNL